MSVRIRPGLPFYQGVAQSGVERLLGVQEAAGSNPVILTNCTEGPSDVATDAASKAERPRKGLGGSTPLPSATSMEEPPDWMTGAGLNPERPFGAWGFESLLFRHTHAREKLNWRSAGSTRRRSRVQLPHRAPLRAFVLGAIRIATPERSVRLRQCPPSTARSSTGRTLGFSIRGRGFESLSGYQLWVQPFVCYTSAMPFKSRRDRREYQRRWAKNRRLTWVLAHGPCLCGSTENLDVDHKDPTQKVSHRIWSWSESRRLAELEKCQILCRACHLVKTKAYRRAKLKHGTRSMYSKGSCRCAECTFANAEYIRRWRENK